MRTLAVPITIFIIIYIKLLENCFAFLGVAHSLSVFPLTTRVIYSYAFTSSMTNYVSVD